MDFEKEVGKGIFLCEAVFDDCRAVREKELNVSEKDARTVLGKNIKLYKELKESITEECDAIEQQMKEEEEHLCRIGEQLQKKILQIEEMKEMKRYLSEFYFGPAQEAADFQNRVNQWKSLCLYIRAEQKMKRNEK